MSLNAAALKILVAKGFDGDDLIALASALETAFPLEQSSAARRQARYRAKKKSESVTGDVTNDVTGDVTSPPKDNKSNPPSSVPIGTGVAADPVKGLFDVGVSILTGTGLTEKQARSLIGKWRKAKSDGDVLTGLVDCRARAISNPVEWLEKRFKPPAYVSASGYQYRGDLDQIEREAKRRGDNDTYWQIQVDRKRTANA